MNKEEIEIQRALVDEVVRHFKMMSEEEQDKLLKVFIQRSLVFEEIIDGYKQRNDDPVDTLKTIGAKGLFAVELYSKIVDLEDEQMLYGGK